MTVWFITGSSRGLGKAIAEYALAKGDSVIATARNPTVLQPLVDKYGTAKVLPLALDVTDYSAAQSAIAQGHKQFGRIDLVINNAGYADIEGVEDVTIENFTKQVNANFLGVVYVSKAALPILRQQGSGHIFQISSLGGRLGTPGLSAYQSAKWAVGGFSTCLAGEVAPLGIKVTVLEPGGMRTDWAGSSMAIPHISQPYEQTVGQTAKMLREYSGTEPTLPEKVGAIIQKVYESSEPPVRMLVGPDAVQYAAHAAAQQAKSDETWKAVSELSV